VHVRHVLIIAGDGERDIRRDVGQDRDLGVQRDTVCPHEAVEQRGDGTLSEPLLQRVEEQLRTPVGVLLPSIELRRL
jgi:hypothetical protein